MLKLKLLPSRTAKFKLRCKRISVPSTKMLTVQLARQHLEEITMLINSNAFFENKKLDLTEFFSPLLMQTSGFQISSKWTIFGIFNQLLSTQNVDVARFARNVE